MSSKRFSGEKLRAVRKARGMTSTELGAAIGCAMDTIGTWERGTHEPKLSAFYGLQAVLGCEAHDLLNDDDDPASVGAGPSYRCVPGNLDGAGRRTHERS